MKNFLFILFSITNAVMKFHAMLGIFKIFVSGNYKLIFFHYFNSKIHINFNADKKKQILH